jgi:hypothetical protein
MLRRKTAARLFRFVSLPILLAGAAGASVVVRADLAALVSNAERVVEGRCLSTRPVLDGAGNIATEVRLLVARGFKGAQAGTEIDFRIPGGEMGGEGLVLAGMPTFRAGEEVLLFLTVESHTGIRVPVGLGQGKFSVQRDAATGAKRLARTMGGIQLVDPATGARLEAPGEERFDYERFATAVERLVREGR